MKSETPQNMSKFELDLLIHQLGYRLGNEIISYTNSGNTRRMDMYNESYEKYENNLEIWSQRFGSLWMEKIRENPTREKLAGWYSNDLNS